MEENDISIKKDNTTKYGEWVCSQFAWLEPDKQKENALRFDDITKRKDNK